MLLRTVEAISAPCSVKAQSIPLLHCELEKKIPRETLAVAFDRLIQTEGLDTVYDGQVSIEDDPLITDRADERRNINCGDNFDLAGHASVRMSSAGYDSSYF